MGNEIAALAGLLCIVPAMAHGHSAAERYVLQERCGKRAAEVFAKEYTPTQTTKDGGAATFSYENHYSEKLNKCFFLEISVFYHKGSTSTQMRLFDLNENKEYGHYWESSQSTFRDCMVVEARCFTERDWRRLAKPYLED